MTGATAARDAASDWEAVRGATDIQFGPLAPAKPLPPGQAPEWLQALGRLLEAIFAPLGRLLGMSWPLFSNILIVLAVLLALFVLWRLFGPAMEGWRRRSREAAPEAWVPAEAEALALLEDADRLARDGRFAEATHLLLRRSVAQIREARPDWLHPASTAREIADLPALPASGREAFAAIAARVERSRFALRDLGAEDWAAAREAYARFTRIELRA